MKTSLAIVIASTTVLLPSIAVSAQPAAPASNQAAAKAQSATAAQNSAATSQKCATSTKSADARDQHDPSARPGKDTGWTPPPRKKSTGSPAPGCDTQPQ